MTKISTLQAELKEGRRRGNTIRQIDFAIQELFKGSEVLVEDHSGKEHETKRLVGLILERLSSEHDIRALFVDWKAIPLVMQLFPKYTNQTENLQP